MFDHDHDDSHAHYHRFREEHGRRLDDEYAQWRSQRSDAHFDEFRRSRDPLGQRDPLAPPREGGLRSLGRAISETVTGTRTPDLNERVRAQPYADDDAAGETPVERFFERS
jgi:hypothetical protein